MMKNEGVKKREENLQKKLEQKQSSEDLKNMYKLVFGSEHGKKVLAHLNKVCGYHEDIFQADPHQNSYGLGRQSVSIHINKVLGGQNE
jgi:hypothetical protein